MPFFAHAVVDFHNALSIFWIPINLYTSLSIIVTLPEIPFLICACGFKDLFSIYIIIDLIAWKINLLMCLVFLPQLYPTSIDLKLF